MNSKGKASHWKFHEVPLNIAKEVPSTIQNNLHNWWEFMCIANINKSNSLLLIFSVWLKGQPKDEVKHRIVKYGRQISPGEVYYPSISSSRIWWFPALTNTEERPQKERQGLCEFSVFKLRFINSNLQFELNYIKPSCSYFGYTLRFEKHEE